MQEYSVSQKHWGTDMSLSVVAESQALASLAFAEAFIMIDEYEKRFSRFLPESELSQLNTKKELLVSDEFMAVLQRSKELYLATNKSFNPLVQIARQGYQADYESLGFTEQSIVSGTYNTDFETVVIDPETNRVILQTDQQLDFGGILKGYLSEKISLHIKNEFKGCQGNIVNLGGDLHTQGVDEAEEVFVFMIYNPVSDVDIPVALRDTSLVTSGTYRRVWKTVAGVKNHILLPDGISNPQSDIISASVMYSDGALAEAYAKSLLIQGVDAIPELSKQNHFDYLLITKTGETLTNII